MYLIKKGHTKVKVHPSTILVRSLELIDNGGHTRVRVESLYTLFPMLTEGSN